MSIMNIKSKLQTHRLWPLFDTPPSLSSLNYKWFFFNWVVFSINIIESTFIKCHSLLSTLMSTLNEVTGSSAVPNLNCILCYIKTDLFPFLDKNILKLESFRKEKFLNNSLHFHHLQNICPLECCLFSSG